MDCINNSTFWLAPESLWLKNQSVKDHVECLGQQVDLELCGWHFFDVAFLLCKKCGLSCWDPLRASPPRWQSPPSHLQACFSDKISNSPQVSSINTSSK